jgi:hypothetical protein
MWAINNERPSNNFRLRNGWAKYERFDKDRKENFSPVLDISFCSSTKGQKKYSVIENRYPMQARGPPKKDIK